jgi:hypothetical protein
MTASLSGLFNLQEFTDAGALLASGRLYTYAQGTTTLKVAYTDKAGTIAHTYTSDGIGGQYIALNARGELPAPMYLAPGSYDIALKTATGATVWTRRADPIDDLAEDLRSDLANPAVSKGSKLVAFMSRLTGAVARWVEDKLADQVSVADFGAVGAGDETSSLQAAVNALPYGGDVWLGNGVTYTFSSLSIPAGVRLRGRGAYASVLRTNKVAGDIITMADSSALLDLKVVTSVSKTSGAHIQIAGNGVQVKAELDGYFLGVSGGVVGGLMVVNPQVDVILRNPVIAAGAGGVQFLNFSNAQVRVLATGPDTGTQPDFGLRFQNGDTAFVEASNITKHGKALLVDPPAAYGCYALTIDGSVFDSAGTITGGIAVSSAEFIPSGGVYNTRISNTWFGLSAGKSGCFLQGQGAAGTVDGITFTGCEFTDNGDSGLLASGLKVQNWVVAGGHAGGNADAGVRAADGTVDFIVNGVKAGNIAGRGPNTYGIKVDAAVSDRYVITDNIVTGNTTQGLLDGGTGTSARVEANLGYDPGPLLGLTLTGSPYTYTAGHSPETIYILGGTVSDVKLNGQTIQNSTGSTVLLNPSESTTITYSSLPTVLRKLN